MTFATDQMLSDSVAFVRKRALAIAVISAIFLLIPIWSIRYPPLQDYPNHLARAYIALQLPKVSSTLKEYYKFSLQPVPNALSDLILIGLEKLLTVEVAGKLLLSINLIGLPIAYTFFLRAAKHPDWSTLSLWGWLFAYNHFFHRGYLNYNLGLWLMFAAIAAYLKYLYSGNRKYGIIVCILALLTYFSHIIPFSILALSVILATSIGYREHKKPSAAIILVPGFVLLVLYMIISNQAFELTWYSDPIQLLKALSQTFMAYRPISDLLLISPALLLLLVLMSRSILVQTGSWERLNWFIACGIILFLVSVSLPKSINILVRPGQRYVLPALLIVLPGLPPIPRSYKFFVRAILGLSILATGFSTGLAYWRQQPVLSGMVDCLDHLSPRKPTYFISNMPFEGSINPYLHFGDYAVISHSTPVPNLFTDYSLLSARIVFPTWKSGQNSADSSQPDQGFTRFYSQLVIFGNLDLVEIPANYHLTVHSPVCSLWQRQ